MKDTIMPQPSDSGANNTFSKVVRAHTITSVLGDAHEIPDHIFDNAHSNRMAAYCQEYMWWRIRGILGIDCPESERPHWLPQDKS